MPYRFGFPKNRLAKLCGSSHDDYPQIRRKIAIKSVTTSNGTNLLARSNPVYSALVGEQQPYQIPGVIDGKAPRVIFIKSRADMPARF
jgi:hypothetical protein